MTTYRLQFLAFCLLLIFFSLLKLEKQIKVQDEAGQAVLGMNPNTSSQSSSGNFFFPLPCPGFFQPSYLHQRFPLLPTLNPPYLKPKFIFSTPLQMSLECSSCLSVTVASTGGLGTREGLTGWMTDQLAGLFRVFFSFSALVGQHGRAGHGRRTSWLIGWLVYNVVFFSFFVAKFLFNVAKNMCFLVANFLINFLTNRIARHGRGADWLTDWLVYIRVFFSCFVAKFFFNVAKNMYFLVATFLTNFLTNKIARFLYWVSKNLVKISKDV